MPHMPTRYIFTIAILYAAVFSSFAQTTNPELPACNEEFAQFLVEQQVSESRSVEQTDKRVRILIRAADFLWKFEESTAREYYTEAFKVATDRFNEKGFEKIENKGMMALIPDHRFEVIRAIAVKDSDWAKRLIEQVMKEYEKAAAERKDSFDRTREIQDIMRVAEDSMKTNPELSRFLFRRAMQHPLDYPWFWALFSIAHDNRQFADSLYGELLTNYANASPRRLLFLSAYPFASERILGPDRFSYGANVPDTLTPNPNLQRQFITTFLRRVTSFAGDPGNLNLPAEENRRPEAAYMVGGLSELEPVIIQKFPIYIQQLSEAKALANSMLTEQMRKDMAERDKRNESLVYDFEQRLKQVEEANSEGRLTDHMIIALLTWGESKTEEQFKQIEPWLDKIKEETGRNESINYFWFLRAKLAVEERRFDDAERFAKKIPEIEHRAILMF